MLEIYDIKKAASNLECAIAPNAMQAARSVVEGDNSDYFSPISIFNEARTSFAENWRQLAGIVLIFLGHLQTYSLLRIAGERL